VHGTAEMRAVDREHLEGLGSVDGATAHPQRGLRQLSGPGQRTRTAEAHQRGLADREVADRSDRDELWRRRPEQRRQEIPDDRHADERAHQRGEADRETREESSPRLDDLTRAHSASLVSSPIHPASDTITSAAPKTMSTGLVTAPAAANVTPLASTAGHTVGSGRRTF